MSNTKSCGTSRFWITTIAWVQIVCNALGMICSLIGLIHDIIWIVHLTKNGTVYMSDTSLSTARNSEWFTISTSITMIKVQICVFIAAFTLVLIICSVGVAFGVILFKGVRQGNVLCLRRWRYYTIFWLVCYLLCSIIVLFLKWWSWPLVLMIVPVLLFVFCIWLVSAFKNKIENGGSEPENNNDSHFGDDNDPEGRTSNDRIQDSSVLQQAQSLTPKTRSSHECEPQSPYNPFYS